MDASSRHGTEVRPSPRRAGHQDRDDFRTNSAGAGGSLTSECHAGAS